MAHVLTFIPVTDRAGCSLRAFSLCVFFVFEEVQRLMTISVTEFQ